MSNHNPYNQGLVPKHIKTYYLLLFALLFNVASLFGYSESNETQIDSLLKVSTNEVYENPNKSIEYGLSVFENDNISTKLKIKGLMLVSLAYSSKRDYRKALEYITKAKELSDQLKDPLLTIEAVTRTGILYQQLKIYDKSMKFLDQSERLCLAYPIRDSVGGLLGKTYLVKGFIYKDNLNCDIALGFFDKGIREYEKLKVDSYNANLSIAYYNKGNCYTMSTDYANAMTSFNKSIKLAKSEKANSLESFAKKGLAEVYTLQGNYQDAIDLLQDALKLSSEVGDLILYQGIYQGLFENHLALNQWEDYQQYYDLYLKTQSDIKISERNSIGDSIEENSNIQNDNINLVKTRYKYRLEILILTAIFIIVLIVIVDFKNRKALKKLQLRIDDFEKAKV